MELFERQSADNCGADGQRLAAGRQRSPGAALAERRLTVVLCEGDDRRPRALHHLAGLHLSTSVLLPGEVEAQLVQQALRVHLRQIGDQNTARTDHRIHLQDKKTSDDGGQG